MSYEILPPSARTTTRGQSEVGSATSKRVKTLRVSSGTSKHGCKPPVQQKKRVAGASDSASMGSSSPGVQAPPRANGKIQLKETAQTTPQAAFMAEAIAEADAAIGAVNALLETLELTEQGTESLEEPCCDDCDSDGEPGDVNLSDESAASYSSPETEAEGYGTAAASEVEGAIEQLRSAVIELQALKSSGTAGEIQASARALMAGIKGEDPSAVTAGEPRQVSPEGPPVQRAAVAAAPLALAGPPGWAILAGMAIVTVVVFAASQSQSRAPSIPRTRSRRRRNIRCRCTIRYAPPDIMAECPPRVIGEGENMRTCQNDAKFTAPQQCRRYYGHCGPI